MPRPILVVPADVIRELFNQMELYERVKRRELFDEVLNDFHPAAPKADVPICTRSQLVAYADKNNRVLAKVHQYVLRNGHLGASGRPDPKWLLHEGTILIPEDLD